MHHSLRTSFPILETRQPRLRLVARGEGPLPIPAGGLNRITYAYVDNSNLWIEGRRASAIARGLARDARTAQLLRIFDASWNPDYHELHQLLHAAPTLLAHATLYGSRTSGNASVFWHAERAGFEVVLSDRNRSGRETDVDPAIIEALEIAAERLPRPEQHRIVLVSGDAHFAPAVSKLTGRGFQVTVMSWSHSLAWALRKAASTVVLLDPSLDQLRLRTAA